MNRLTWEVRGSMCKQIKVRGIPCKKIKKLGFVYGV